MAAARSLAAAAKCQQAFPAHFDAEVFSALGRLTRAGDLAERFVEPILNELARQPSVAH
jgi:hypothetical protein